jgi:hypothetical protein
MTICRFLVGRGSQAHHLDREVFELQMQKVGGRGAIELRRLQVANLKSKPGRRLDLVVNGRGERDRLP